MHTKTVIDDQLLDQVCNEARHNARLRMNRNMHATYDDPVNRMINALQVGTYVQPHRHLSPSKAEMFIVLRGSLRVYLFSDNGNITDCIELAPANGKYGIEIAPDVWHCLCVTSPDTAIYDIKQGPYTPIAPQDIAPWAPAPDDADAAKAFMNKLLDFPLQHDAL